MRRLALEELVARGTKTLPHLIGVTARHGADLLPASLQGDQFIGRLLPLLAHLQRFGRFAQLVLQLKVVLHFGLHVGIEAALGLEKPVARRTEPLVDAGIVLLRREADRLPHLLYLQQTVAGPVPLLARGVELLGKLFGLLAEPRFQFEIFRLLGLDVLEEGLMLLVYTARSLLETLPKRLLELIGDGARLTPLVVEFLQFVKCLHDRRFQNQRLGRFAQRELLLVVLFQIEVAQLLVDLDEVVEILDMQVVGLPQILDVLLGNQPRLLPALLQFAELGERMVERLVRVDQFLQLLDDLQLDFQVGFLLGVERRDELVAAAAVLLEQVFEPKLLSIGSRHELRFVAAGFDKSPALRLDLGAVRLVEGYLDGFHHPAQRLHRLLVEHLGEQGDHLLLAPAVEKRIRRSGRTFVHRFTVCRLLLVEPRAPRGQCSLLVREIDPLGRCGDRFPGRRYGRNSRLRLFHRCGPDRLLRRSGSLHGRLGGSLPDGGRHGFPRGIFGRYGDGYKLRCGSLGSGRFLHIFSIADLFLRNRGVGDFSSHLTLSFD